MHRNRFSPERLQKLDLMIKATNASIYSKLANCAINFKTNEKDLKKNKGWSASDWKKHMDHISQIAAPKKVFDPPPVKVRHHSILLSSYSLLLSCPVAVIKCLM